jgi:hypothetical protein
VDARRSLPELGLFYFCSAETENGRLKWGAGVFSCKPPPEWKCLGIHHTEGKAAALQWQKRYQHLLAEFLPPQSSDNNPEKTEEHPERSTALLQEALALLSNAPCLTDTPTDPEALLSWREATYDWIDRWHRTFSPTER